MSPNKTFSFFFVCETVSYFGHLLGMNDIDKPFIPSLSFTSSLVLHGGCW